MIFYYINLLIREWKNEAMNRSFTKLLLQPPNKNLFIAQHCNLDINIENRFAYRKFRYSNKFYLAITIAYYFIERVRI